MMYVYACQFLSSDDCICQVSVNLDYKNVARAELIKFSSGFPWIKHHLLACWKILKNRDIIVLDACLNFWSFLKIAYPLW
jgi:hypothetical protein